MKYKNILFSFLAIILVFFIIEIFCTFFFVLHQSQYHGPMANFLFDQNKKYEIVNIYKAPFDKYTQKMKPGTYKNKFGIDYKVNSFGFLGEEFSIEKKNDCRIISFGGSTTAGILSGQPYPKILEEKLHKNNVNCEVLNFGLDSKSLNYIENLLVNEAINYKPNIITILNNRNSVMYDSFGNSSVSGYIIDNKLDYFIYRIDKFLFSEVMTYRFMQLSYKRVLSLLYNSEDKIVSPYHPARLHLKNYFTSKYFNQITNIINFCKLNDIEVVLIKQAYYIEPSYQKSLKSLSNSEILEKLSIYHKETDRDKKSLFWMYTNQILNNILDEIKLKNSGVVIVDPIQELLSREKDEVFYDDGIHLTADGHEIIADKIIQSIMKSFNLPEF